jgi:hypothetical protein
VRNRTCAAKFASADIVSADDTSSVARDR